MLQRRAGLVLSLTAGRMIGLEFETVEARSAQEALDQAERSRRQVRRLQAMPGWFGPTVGAMMAVNIASSDLARASASPWLFAALGTVYCFGVGIAVGVVRQRQGVVGRWEREAVTASALATAACLIVGATAYAVAWAVGIWARGTVAGLCTGVAFWVAAATLNRRFRRSTEAAIPDRRS